MRKIRDEIDESIPPIQFFDVPDAEPGRRAAIYARFSTDAQDPLSIKRQIDLCTERAEQQGFKVVAIFSDQAKTGMEVVGREGYSGMMQAAKDGLIDAVFSEDMARLHRRQSGVHFMFEGLEELGIDIYDGDAAVDDETVSEKAKYAYKQRKVIRTSCARGRVTHSKAGKLVGRNPYGFVVDARRPGRPSWDPERLAIVDELFSRLKAGEQPKAIADDLNVRGIMTPGDCVHTDMGRTGFQRQFWTHEMIRLVVTNRIYKGWVVFGQTKTVVKAGKRPKYEKIDDESLWIKVHEPHFHVIPTDLWDEVNEMYRRRKNLAKAKAPNSCLLTGLLHCGRCNARMHVIHDQLGRGRYFCDAMDPATSKRCLGCGTHLVQRVERAVIDGMEADFDDPETVRSFREQYENRVVARQEADSADRSQLLARIEELKERRFALTDPKKANRYTEEELDDFLARIRREMEPLKKELAELPKNADMPRAFRELDVLSAGIKQLKSVVPMRPRTDAQVQVLAAVYTIVRGITVAVPGPDKATRLSITFDVPGPEPGPGEAAPEPMLVREVSVDNILLDAAEIGARKAAKTAELDAEAGSGGFDIPDEAWALAEPIIARLCPEERPAAGLRATLDGMVFALRTSTALQRVPSRFGSNDDFQRRYRVLTSSYAWDEIVVEWQRDCPAVLEKADLKRFGPDRTYRTKKRRLPASALPTPRDLQALAARTPPGRLRTRILAVMMSISGARRTEVQAQYDCNLATLKGWVAEFKSQGEASFRVKVGRKRKLSDEEFAKLLAIARRRYDPDRPERVITLKRIAEIAEALFGIRFGLARTMYSVFKSRGYIWGEVIGGVPMARLVATAGDDGAEDRKAA